MPIAAAALSSILILAKCVIPADAGLTFGDESQTGQFLWVSDAHYDAYYGQSTAAWHQADAPCGGTATGGHPAVLDDAGENMFPYSHFGCGSTDKLVVAMLESAKEVLPQPDFILFTGDATRHFAGCGSLDPNQTVSDAINFVYNSTHALFGDVPVLELPPLDLGNNDQLEDYALDVTSYEPCLIDESGDLPPATNEWLTYLSSLATYTFARATFPQGRRALSLRVPGAGIGTVLSLPNIGYNPAPFAVRYLRGDSAATNDSNPGMMTASGVYEVYEDLAYNFPRRLEAFWPDAKVLSVRTGNSYKGGKNGCSAIAVEEDENKLLLTPPCSVTGVGCTPGENPKLHSPATRLSLDYEGPTRAGPRRSQTIDCSAVQGIAAGPSEGGASVVTSKQFVQYNVQQDLQAYYREICSFQRIVDGSESQAIEGKMRVAAFLPHILQGTDGNDPPKHDERLALALYDYRITLKRLSEEAESII